MLNVHSGPFPAPGWLWRYF